MSEVTTGNNLLPPPRRSGNTEQDVATLWEYANDLYRALILEKNVTGAVDELDGRTTVIEQEITNNTTVVQEITNVVQQIDGEYVASVNGQTPAPDTKAVTITPSHIAYTPPGVGAVASTVQAQLARTFHVDDWGAVGDGTTDDREAIQAALDACAAAGGGTVMIGPKRYYIGGDAQLVIPTDVMLAGGWFSAGERRGTNFALQPYALILNPTYAIKVNWGGGLRSMLIMREGLVRPTTVREMLDCIAAFAGTAISCEGDDTYGARSEPTLKELCIIGFDMAMRFFRCERPWVQDIMIDCTNGWRMERIRDVALFDKVHVWPTVTTHQNPIIENYNISGVSDNGAGFMRLTVGANPLVTGDRCNVILTTGGHLRKRTTLTVVDSSTIDTDIPWSASYAGLSGKLWPGVIYREGIGGEIVDSEACSFDHCMVYGYTTGYRVGDNSMWARFNFCSYDNYISAAVDTDVGFDLAGVSRGAIIQGCDISSCGTALRVDQAETMFHRVLGSQLNTYDGTAKLLDLRNGRVILVGCETRAVASAVIEAGMDKVVMAAVRMPNVTLTNNAAAGVLEADTACDFANILNSRGEVGRLRVGAPTNSEHVALLISGKGAADANQGTQIQWLHPDGSTSLYQRVVASGTMQFLPSTYSGAIASLTQAGLWTVASLAVSGTADFTGAVTFDSSATVAGAVTIGEATAGEGALTALHVRGNPAADSNRGAEIRLTNPVAALSMYFRLDGSGRLQVLPDSYSSSALTISQAGTVTLSGLLAGASASFSSTLDVSGAASFDDDVAISNGAALTIGAATAGGGSLSPLIVQGSPDGDPNRGGQIELRNPTAALSMHLRVDSSGRLQLLPDAYSSSVLTISQTGTTTISGATTIGGALSGTSASFSTTLNVTGNVTFGDDVSIAEGGTLTIGAATAGGGALTALHVRGSPTADTARGGEIQITNPTAAASFFVRVDVEGDLALIPDDYVAAALQVRQSGSVLLGPSTMTTSATAGFPYLPAAAGAPSGAPTSIGGYVPAYIDTTNLRLYFYIAGVWRYTALT